MVSTNHASSNDCHRTCVNYVSLTVLVFRNKKIGVEWFKCSVRKWRMITWANKLYTVLVSKLALNDRVYLGLLHVLEADLKWLVMSKLKSKRKTIPTSFYRQHARYLLGKSRTNGSVSYTVSNNCYYSSFLFKPILSMFHQEDANMQAFWCILGSAGRWKVWHR